MPRPPGFGEIGDAGSGGADRVESRETGPPGTRRGRVGKSVQHHLIHSGDIVAIDRGEHLTPRRAKGAIQDCAGLIRKNPSRSHVPPGSEKPEAIARDREAERLALGDIQRRGPQGAIDRRAVQAGRETPDRTH